MCLAYDYNVYLVSVCIAYDYNDFLMSMYDFILPQ